MPPKPRTPAPDRPPPSLPPKPIQPPPADMSPLQQGEEYHTPTPSFETSPREEGGSSNHGTAVSLNSPSPHRLPPPSSPTENNGQEGRDAKPSAAGRARPQPSQGSPAAISASPSSSPLTPDPVAKSPPSPAPPAVVNSSTNVQSTPNRGEALKPPSPAPPVETAVASQFDPAEEAATSPLPPTAVENAVPPDARVEDRWATSVALRLATAVLSLAAFSVMVSARTSGWAGDYYGRHKEYRYAVGANVIVCVYSIAQCFGEIRGLITPTLSLFLDQALAYLLMSASSAAASRNDLWVSRFGTDPFNKKIKSAVWLSFIAFLTLAAKALISTADFFRKV